MFLSGANEKVLPSVVTLISGNVVNSFPSIEDTSTKFLGDQPMLVIPSAAKRLGMLRNSDQDIAIPADSSFTFKPLL
jgi:hypothetical protein